MGSIWKMLRINIWVFVVLFSLACSAVRATVSYDDKAFIINGRRRILISGSIHYPRSTPEMWPDLIQKAKDGGLDVIQTYVFWNGHEPSPGKYNFEGRFDLVKFIKIAQQAGLYVHLRIGPYVCAEWNFGGFPVWLKYVPGMEFRTDNQPFKVAMQGFVQKIVSMMKSEKLFEPQGGPIIMSQIENEYGPVEWEIGAPGKAYSAWAEKMAVGLNTGVPWIMCKQETTPDPIVPHRPAEDMAFAVARFVQNNGSFFNYYMPGTYLDDVAENVKYSDFVHKELILFSMADVQRLIPSMIDGLKPSQRKILFCSFKRNFIKEAKVAQFSGYVSEHSAYHHGEQSLAGTIIGMAQDYISSNNINLLLPNGQFGTRGQGGKDHARRGL